MRFVEFLITEAKQDVINLGYPPIIASMLYQRFGKLAFLFGKWYRDCKTNDPDNKDWFQLCHWSIFKHNENLSDLVKLYDATTDSESYSKMLDFVGWQNNKHFYDEFYLAKQREALKKQIEQTFFGDSFFTYYSLPTAIIDGTEKNIAPYKNLSFWDAQKKFDKKRIFQEMTPLKVYPNGYKWINVGKRCHLVGHLMKNCGSAGVMSLDPDRTIIALFDKTNKPHVVVTYSPNEKRISGDEGVASSEVKSLYHNYILDLAQTLGVNFDASRTKSTFLKLKYLLRNKISNIQKLRPSSVYDEYFVFTTLNGREYYTNGSEVLPADELRRLGNYAFKNKTGSLVANAFNHVNRQYMDPQLGINYIPLNQFIQAN
jgi:hypothetical protein